MPDMRDQLAKLYELQQIDSGMAARQKARRELDDGGEADARLSAAQQDLTAREEQLKGLHAQLTDRELRLKGAEEEHKARSKQAYGGTIADPKQLSALEKKIAELARHKGKLEEEILELMDQVEMAQAAVAKQQALVADLAAKSGGIKERHASGTDRLKHELRELKHQREALVAHLDPALIKQYDSIREKTGGLAVAAVHLGSCTGCKVTVPSMYAPRLRSHEQLIRCDNCHRILYLPEGESAFKPEEDR